MHISTFSIAVFLFVISSITISQQSVTTRNDSLLLQPTSLPVSTFFNAISGGVNALYRADRTAGSMDLSVMVYRYFLVTGRRFKSDSLHKIKVNSNVPIREIYKGFEFLVMNRVALSFDSIQAIANDYITSLQSSPITFRMNKEFFLSQTRTISALSYNPVLSILITGDARIVPYNLMNNINIGASGHLYFTLASVFKRFEFDLNGKEIDQGTMYLKPSVGIAYGSKELMSSLNKNREALPLFSSECRLGFKSENHAVKDCSLLVRYTLSDVIGPKLRAGILLSSIN